jgi:hypothetical protein
MSCRAVYASVGHRQFPVAEEAVLFLQTGEGPSPQGVFLDVVHASLHLPLVAGRVRSGGHEHRPIVFAEGADLGVELGVEPVGLRDGRLEVVQDEAARDPAEVPEGVLQAAEEVVGGLAGDDLAVALAGVAQDDAEDVRLASLAVKADDRRAGAEVDLGLVAGVALDAAEGELVHLLEAVDEPADGVVAAGVAVFGDEVLVDPLSGQPLAGLGGDAFAPRLTAAEPARAAWRWDRARPGGRIG